MKVYICGKISGLPIEKARNRFQQAENFLLAMGHEPINPMKLPHEHDKSWKSYMKECISYLFDCEAIYPIEKEIEDSLGAKIEMSLASHLGIINLIIDKNIQK